MKQKIQGKYVYRGMCQAILTVVSTFIFYIHWSNFIYIHYELGHLSRISNVWIALLVYAIVFVFVGRWLKAFRIGVERKTNILASQFLTAFTVEVLEVFISVAIAGRYRLFGTFCKMYFLMFFLHMAVLILLVIPMIDFYRKLFPPLRVLEINGKRNNDIYYKMSQIYYKYQIDKVMRYDSDDEELKSEIEKFDAVLIGDMPSKEKNRVLKLCFDMDKRVYFVPKISDIIVKSTEELNLFDTPMFLARNIGINWWQQIIKRFFDIVLSLFALILLSPIMIVTAIAIKLEDGGPVFYKQERCTIGCKKFMILKFRSMIVDAEKDGKPHPAGENDDRITKVGHIIRACRVDELPQLVNILKGEMSIIGPRPERVEHVEKYTKEIPEFTFRSKVKGGLSGMAQVYGKYNTTALDKLKLDLLYITNYSLLLDLQIIFETVKILTQKESTEGFSEERVKEMHDGVKSE
ncbi:MAG: exopolysaccharide biosynthesis polyprenyl glycosylphosphotransferase [Butyrivibrio sp.]|nr:exopolysaccharide biosynthesis polyprenyl glycosylphosphotransferase [Butyrivibrio sp.]